MNARLRSAFALVVAGLVVLVSGAAVKSAPGTVVPRSAEPMGSVPATISGVANGHVDKDAPVPACGAVAGVDWYTVQAPHRGAMVARLVARGELDAQVAVYRIVRSQRLPILCAATNRHGRARVAWYAYTEGSYLVGVARRQGSAVGPFDLTVLASDRPESTPGTSLPAAGATGTVDPVLDASDAWSVQMNRGTTYRLNLTTPWKVGCIAYGIYRPKISSFAHATAVATAPCGRLRGVHAGARRGRPLQRPGQHAG